MTLAETLAKKAADDKQTLELLKKEAAKDTPKSKDADTKDGTHRDGNSNAGTGSSNTDLPQNKIAAEGKDVVVKDSVVQEGNKDNVVTAAVVNDVANLAPNPDLAPVDAHAAKNQNAAGESMLAGSVETVAADGRVIQSSQNPAIIASSEPSAAARTSNIQTGMEVSQPKYTGDTPIAEVLKQEELSDAVTMNLREKAKGIYQADHLARFHRADGTVVVPHRDGRFYPDTDADHKELQHHAKNGLVREVTPPKKK